MELSQFCPVCGQETSKLYGEEKKYCKNCYPKKIDLLEIPEEVEIEVCSVCGRMKQRGEWLEKYTIQEQLVEKFTEFNQDNVEMELQFWEEDEETKVRVHAYTEGSKIKYEYDSKVEFKQIQCKQCSKHEGGYYKVKLQLRGDIDLKPISDQIVDKAAEITNKNRKNFLSNIEKTDHGYNFYMSTEKMAKQILDMLRTQHDPEIKRSYELIGEQDGQEVYRNIISVRIKRENTED